MLETELKQKIYGVEKNPGIPSFFPEFRPGQMGLKNEL
jgi:hypothetical protein